MMAELGIDANLPQRIFHVLTMNQDRGGLTISEIREALGVGLNLDKRAIKRVDVKIYKAISVLINRGDIQRWTSPVDRRFGVYALPGQSGMPLELEPEKLMLQQLAVVENDEEEVKAVVDYVPSQPSKLSLITEELFDGWNIISSPGLFPSQTGLYTFLSGITGSCLYVGRATNLRERCRHHEKWEEAIGNDECPYAAYKVIPNEQISPERYEQSKQELVFLEGLLIELLRPELNTALPLLGGNVTFTGHDFLQVELAHWTQFVSKKHQPYHPLMLTDKGYVVLKRIEPEKQWLRVLYDRDYAHKWADDLAGQVDNFFSVWELREQGDGLVKSSSIPTIEIVVNDSFKVRISISQI